MKKIAHFGTLVSFLLLVVLALSAPVRGQSAGLKVINALPPPILDFSSSFIDALVDGNLFFSKVEYLFGSSNGTHGPYRPLDAPGTYNVSFRYTNHPERGIIASTQLQITQPGTYHTVVIFGRNTVDFPLQTAHLVDQSVGKRAISRPSEEGVTSRHRKGFKTSITEEDEEETNRKVGSGKGLTSIRYFNAGISLGPTTVKMNGKDLFASTSYGQAWNGGQYVEFDTGAKGGYFMFEVVDARYEEIQITFDKLFLSNGCAFTIFSTGVLGNYYSPYIVVHTKDLC
jgi:hypothetical protein